MHGLTPLRLSLIQIPVDQLFRPTVANSVRSEFEKRFSNLDHPLRRRYDMRKVELQQDEKKKEKKISKKKLNTICIQPDFEGQEGEE